MKEGYRLSSKNEEMDIEAIHQFISRSYWAEAIPKEIMARALQHSLCFGVFDSENRQVGFARMVTDRATFAYLADVYILDEHRGQGLAKGLMEAIQTHPELQGLRRMMLATRDAHGLYAQFGFKPLNNPNIIMELWSPDIYKDLR